MRLAAAEARAWPIRIAFGLVLLWFALLLLQVLVLLPALSPVLAQTSSWSSVGSTLAIALVPATIVTHLAARELGRAKDISHAEFDKHTKLDRP
jgi:hypothetical protein